MYSLISNIQKVIKINDCHFIYTINSGLVVPNGYLRKKYSRRVWTLWLQFLHLLLILPLWAHWKATVWILKQYLGISLTPWDTWQHTDIVKSQNLRWQIVEVRALNVTRKHCPFENYWRVCTEKCNVAQMCLCFRQRGFNFYTKNWTSISQLGNNLYE